ncbi:TPA: hypothetical protein PPN70_002313 [Serratia rubidaea]|uniref:contact-dependent growth inhibition system immunity protein n=1 Tax=Serratia rubidaea TaxID=61652 RepID=UPI0023B05BA0|nr:contact-dependent growth inhibition system immunity protein [Serratia rubidaea]MDK1703240.1 contact-dependent growth inhibition system immunity protein [Serratia rubidaea]HDJ1439892.1 hypothetical protein [Serratia rubidaea]HDJ1461399.1 hypothetical protein [Serratia rubidaea]HDJ2772543.1 hypothetical protein [Serratia rubidaea]
MRFNGDFSELNHLISLYFGQDYDLFTDAETVEGVIDGFLEQSGYQVIGDILEEAREFQATYAERLNEEMAIQFSSDFVPECWGSSAQEFFTLIQQKAEKKLADLKCSERLQRSPH